MNIDTSKDGNFYVVDLSGAEDFWRTLEEVKKIPGRTHNPSTKEWLVPTSEADTLKQLGLDLPNPQEEVGTANTEQLTNQVSEVMKTPLYPYQLEGVTWLCEKDGVGLIGDEPGLGKTIQAIAWSRINPKARPLLVICPASVKEVWRSQFEEHAGIKASVASGMKPDPKMLTKDVVIINYDILSGWVDELAGKFRAVIIDEAQYLKNRKAQRTKAGLKILEKAKWRMFLTGTPIVNRPVEFHTTLSMLSPEFKNFWHFVHRYCLPGDAPILMSDFTEKPISKVEPGDVVIGWSNSRAPNSQRRLVESRVIDVLTRKAPLQKTKLTSGRCLVSTPDHQWLTGRKSDGYSREYQEAKTGRLEGRGRGRASQVAYICDGVSEPEYFEAYDYKEGYIIGLFRGDGYCTSTQKIRGDHFKETHVQMATEYSARLAMLDEEPINRIEQYLNDFGVQHHRSVVESGKRQGRTAGKSYLHAISCNNRESILFLLRGFRKSKAWAAGFLAGMYDAEGSKNGLTQCKSNNPINCDWIECCFDLLGIGFVTRSNKPDTDVMNYWVDGGRAGFLDFWRVTYPSLTRKLKAHLFNYGGRFIQGSLSHMIGIPQVQEITPMVGEHTVYTLTTETGNYVAYGHGSKNCDAKRNGFGWDFTGASHTAELHERVSGRFMLRRKKADVIKDLPAKSRVMVPFQLPDARKKEYARAESDFTSWVDNKMASEGMAAGFAKMQKLSMLAVESVLKQQVEWIGDFLGSGKKLVVMGTRKKILGEIYNTFGSKAVRIDGSVPVNKRGPIIERFQTDAKVQLLVGNIEAAGTGITLTAADSMAFVEPALTPGASDQAEDRIHRIGQENAVSIYFLYPEGTIIEDRLAMLDRKREVVGQVVDGYDVAEFKFSDLIAEMRARQG